MKKILWVKYYLAVLVFAPLIFKGIESELGPFESGRVCTSCHSMRPFTEEYIKSNHYSGRSGVNAGCVECHVHGGLFSIDAIRLLGRDLFYEVYRPIRKKEDLDIRRPVLAKRVRDSLAETKSRSCIKCHPEESMVPSKDRGKKAHLDMNKSGETCIDCHYNLVHERVPWEGKAKKLEDGMLDL